MTEARAEDSRALVEQLRPLLANKHPAVVGSALAHLTATWVSGHHPADMRAQLIELQVETVRSLVASDQGKSPPAPAEYAATISSAQLTTEEGITETGFKIAHLVCQHMIWPIVHNVPPRLAQALFERFLSEIIGAACGEIGPDRAKDALEAVKRAIDDAGAEHKLTH